MQSKRFLFISTLNGDPWGGSEPFWFKLAMALAQQGHKVVVAWLHWPQRQPYNEALEATGCRVLNLPNYKFTGNFLQKIYCKIGAARMLKKEIANGQYHHTIISQGGFEDVTHSPFDAIRPLLGKYSLVYHNYNTGMRLSANRSKKMRLWATGAALNLGDSQCIFDAMPTVGGFGVPNSMVQFNPIGFAVPAEPAEWSALQNGNWVLTMLAQLDCRRKAQDVLVVTLAQPKWKERNWILWLYGAGADKPLLEKLIAENGLHQRVLLKGHTTDVQGVLAQSHAVLQITHIDAMPIAVSEAMSMARPCFVSRVGDMPLWITEGYNGYIADAATVEQIDALLEKAWTDKDNWQQLGKNAFATFAQKYPNPYEAYYIDVIMNS